MRNLVPISGARAAAMASALVVVLAASCSVDKSGLGAGPGGQPGGGGAGGSAAAHGGAGGRVTTGGGGGGSPGGAGATGAGAGGTTGAAGDGQAIGGSGAAAGTGGGGEAAAGAAGDGSAGTTAAGGAGGEAGAGDTGAAGAAGEGAAGGGGAAGAIGGAAGTGEAGSGGRGAFTGGAGRGGFGGCGSGTCPDGCCRNGQCVTTQSQQDCGTNGAQCQACDPCFRCGAANTCEPDPAATWDIVCVSATVDATKPNGMTWDMMGPGVGPDPDPFCQLMTSDGRTVSSPIIMNVLNPTWNADLTPMSGGLTTTLLETDGGWTVSVRDSDATSPNSNTPNELICSVSPMVQDADFAAGELTFTDVQSCTSLTLNVTCAE